MAKTRSTVDLTGLSGAREISQSRLASITSVKVSSDSGRWLALPRAGNEASSHFVIRGSSSDVPAGVVQKK